MPQDRDEPRPPENPEPDAPAPVGEQTGGEPAGRGADLVRLALPFYGIVALFAFGYALFGGGLQELFGEAMPTLPGLAVGVGLGLALVVLSRVATRAWSPMTRMTDALAELVGPVGLWPALLLALLSGTAEELLFRGALWSHLGLVGTTLLFGLVHVLPRRSLWVFPVFATLAGLLFGLLREGTQSVWPCVLGHVTVNALNLAWIGSLAARRKD